MFIRLHRWQPRSNRYRTEKVDLADAKPILDLIVANGTGVRVAVDLSVDQKVMRTQRVDRITLSAVDDQVDIYLSPVIDRTYKRELNSGGARKARPTDILCDCHHEESAHSKQANDRRDRICLVPGCTCARYTRRGIRRDIVDAALADTVAHVPVPGGVQEHLNVPAGHCIACGMPDELCECVG